jgi:hypothetical protein
VKLKHQLKLNQQKPLLLSKQGLDEDDDIIVNDDVTFGRNRQAEKFGKIVYEDDHAPLSDYVTKRLARSRALAMAAYRKAQI